MREVHRFIADSIYSSDRFDAMVERDRRAQAGADRTQGRGGGRRARRPDRAFYLALLGHEVTVYDSNAEAGRHAALRAARIPAAEGRAATARSN